MGFLSGTYPDEAAMLEAAYALAGEIASKSPVAVMGTKHILNYARDHPVAQALEYQCAWNAAMLQSEDLPKSFVASLNKETAQYAKL